MPFAFVSNNATIDCSARKRIRSHVAIGRNAGKTVVRPSRKEAVVLGVRPRTTKVVKQTHEMKSQEDVHEIERQLSDCLSVLCFPVPLTPRSRGVVQKAISFISGPRHPPELDSILDATGTNTSMWVQFMFLDEACLDFHCSVAIFVTALDNLVVKPGDPAEAMHHLSHTFRLVNERLTGKDAVSDATMAVVVSMSQFERHQGRYRRGIVHLEGLLRMVELRGGIGHLTQYKPNLTQKIFRADLEFALYLGSATRFSIKDLMLGSTAMLGLGSNVREDDQHTSKVSELLFLKQFNSDVHDLLIDMTGLAKLLNDIYAGQRRKLHNYTFHDTIILLGYRLISISPLGGFRSTDSLGNAVHVGLAAFLITFLRRLDHKIPDMPLLSQVARSAAQGYFNQEWKTQELLLWLLFIGNASIFKLADDTWILSTVTRTIHTLDLWSWEDVRRTLAKWPWVHALHDKTGQALCQRSFLSLGLLAVGTTSE